MDIYVAIELLPSINMNALEWCVKRRFFGFLSFRFEHNPKWSLMESKLKMACNKLRPLISWSVRFGPMSHICALHGSICPGLLELVIISVYSEFGPTQNITHRKNKTFSRPSTEEWMAVNVPPNWRWKHYMSCESNRIARALPHILAIDFIAPEAKHPLVWPRVLYLCSDYPLTAVM